MTINFINPLSQAFGRMKKALFQPFDIGKWFTVGFTAFLAGLLDGGGSSGGGGNGSKRYRDHIDPEELFNLPQRGLDWLADNPGWFTLIIIGIVILFVVIIVLNWLSSRGKFMFLHNVVLDKSEVVKPWHEYRKEGNSLFIWRVIFGLIVIFGISILMYMSYDLIREIVLGNNQWHTYLSDIFGLGLLSLIFFIITAYITLFLNDFVVPLMYKNRITCTQAWNQFLPLMRKHFWYFIAYGLFLLVIRIAIFIAIMIVGLVTCCVGFLLLIIPYIGAVILLPVSYTLRSFSLEFFEQFGEAYTIFPKPEPEIIEEITEA